MGIGVWFLNIGWSIGTRSAENLGPPRINLSSSQLILTPPTIYPGYFGSVPPSTQYSGYFGSVPTAAIQGASRWVSVFGFSSTP